MNRGNARGVGGGGGLRYEMPGCVCVEGLENKPIVKSLDIPILKEFSAYFVPIFILW